MKVHSIMILLLFVSLLSACGVGKKKAENSVNLLFLGGIGSGIPGMTGGTMIYGYSGAEQFSIAYNGQAIELPNGEWTMSVITWDGYDGAVYDQVFQGVTRCGTTSVNLSGGEVVINMALSSVNCASIPLFGTSATKEANGEPKPFVPAACAEENGVFDFGDGLGCRNSVATSYKLFLPDSGFTGDGPGLVSECVDEATATTAELEHGTIKLEVPALLPIPASFPIGVRLFDGAACTGSIQTVLIGNIYGGGAINGPAKIDEDDSATDNIVNIYNDPCSMSQGLLATPHDPVGATTDYIICNTTQFNTFIETNAGTLDASYWLARNLDFTGIPFTDEAVVSGEFTGKLHGEGHDISNVTINSGAATNDLGVFASINGDGTSGGGGNLSNANVNRLSLTNITINSTDDNNVGALAGAVYQGSRIEQMLVSNVSIGSVQSGFSPTGIGGLVGTMFVGEGTAGNGVGSSEIWGVKMSTVYIDVGDVSFVGGLVGDMQDNNNLRSSVIEGMVMTSNGNGGSEIGGAVGKSYGPNNEIWGVVVTGLVMGTVGVPMEALKVNIGGIVGSMNLNRMAASKAVGTIYSDGTEIGGGVGRLENQASVRNSIVDVDIFSNPTNNVGGFAGYATAGTGGVDFDDVRAFGDVTCGANCGGFIGFIEDTGTDNYTITKCIARGDVTSNDGGASSNVGGFLGKSAASAGTFAFNENQAHGNVTATSGQVVGGFAGLSTANQTWSHTISTGDVTTGGATSTGAFAGSLNNTIINNALISGTSDGSECVGFISASSLTSVYYVAGTTDPNCPTTATSTNVTLGVAQDLTNLVGFTGTGVWNNIDNSTLAQLSYYVPIEAVGETYTGSEFDPIILTTPAQWNAIGDTPQLMNKSFKLGGPINFGAAGLAGDFTPVGSISNPFTGTLMGNNQTISSIDKTETSISKPLGLIRAIGFDQYDGTGKITQWDLWNWDADYSLYIDDVSFDSDSHDTGVLVGQITDSSSNGTHEHRYGVEIRNVHISNSFVSGGPATFYSGGAIGKAYLENANSRIQDIFVSSTDVTSQTTAAGVGGVIGRVEGFITGGGGSSPRLEYLTFDSLGTVSNPSGNNVGGIVGSSTNASIRYEMLLSDGDVEGQASVGGLFGSFSNATIEWSRATGFIDGADTTYTDFGGLVGLMTSGTITGSYSTADVDGFDNIGCLVGNATSSPLIENSWGDCFSIVDYNGGANKSYFVNGAFLAPGPTINFYAAPIDEGIGATAAWITQDGTYNASVLSTSIALDGDPWVFDPVTESAPQFMFVAFPEFLNH